jgi:hypothetical protein
MRKLQDGWTEMQITESELESRRKGREPDAGELATGTIFYNVHCGYPGPDVAIERRPDNIFSTTNFSRAQPWRNTADITS